MGLKPHGKFSRAVAAWVENERGAVRMQQERIPGLRRTPATNTEEEQ